MSNDNPLEPKTSEDNFSGTAADRVLPLRLDAQTSTRLATIAATLGYSEGAAAKIAIRFAAENLMGVVRRTMQETAREYVTRTLGLPPDDKSRRTTPITDDQLDEIVGRAHTLQFDIYRANALLERRRYLKHFGPLRYQGSESDQATARLLFEPGSDANLREALRDAGNEVATILRDEVELCRRRWTNIRGLRHQLIQLERQRSGATPGIIGEKQAQAQALPDVITQTEQDGQVTEQTLSAVRGQPLIGERLLATLQRADLNDTQKLAAMKEQLAAMQTRVDESIRLRERDDQWVEALQRSPAWNDADALAERIQWRQSKQT